MKADQVFLDKFHQLKKDFAAKLPVRIKQIDDALQSCKGRLHDGEQLEILYRLLHSLGGTAGSFGFAHLGLEARKIEGQIAVLKQRGNWDEQDIAQIAEALQQLKLAAQ